MSALPSRTYFRQRQRNRMYETVIRAVEVAGDRGLKRRDIAASTGKSPSQISHWLSGPANWTIDNISDVLFALGAELQFSVCEFKTMVKDNKFHELNVARPEENKPLQITRTSGAADASKIKISVLSEKLR